MDKNKLFYVALAILLSGSAFFAFLALNSDTYIPKNDDIIEISNLGNNNDVTDFNIETLVEGTGNGAENGNSVTVHYTGTFTDGTIFDSSIDRGEPFTFTLGEGNVIQGWELGVVGMKVGEKRKLTIPSSLAYGSEDYNGIPGGSTLIFEIELLSIN